MISFLLILFVTVQSFAGNEVGNGGDVVKCKNSLELLDFFEAEQLKRHHIQLPKGKDYLTIAKQTLARLQKFNPQLQRQYELVLEKLSTRLKFVDDADFRDIKDSFEVALPKDCTIEQIANQQDVRGERLIYIAKKLWDKLSPEHQAGLLLHEIIYEHFIFLGEKNSVKARQFNAFVSSDKMTSMSKEEYLKFVRSLKLPIY